MVITNIGKGIIDEGASEAGQRWEKKFLDYTMTISGVKFAASAHSYNYLEIAMHFIGWINWLKLSMIIPRRAAKHCTGQDARREQDMHIQRIGGPIPDPLKPMRNAEKTWLYVIYPNAKDRRTRYAPPTNVAFFYGIDEDTCAVKAPNFFTTIAKSDSCLGYVSI